ncbi:unnamed protein product [Aphanomyces euteiches]
MMVAKLSNFRVDRQNDVDPTMCSAIPNTVRWKSPEVILGKAFTEAADVYSLGVILSEMDTRKIPFWDCTNTVRIMTEIARGSLNQHFSRLAQRQSVMLPTRVSNLIQIFDPPVLKSLKCWRKPNLN